MSGAWRAVGAGLLAVSLSGLGCGAGVGQVDEASQEGAALVGTVTLPGRVQAEDYRAGGEGVGYHDTTAGNAGGAYRSDGVDLQATTDSGGGYDVGWIAAGEWLTYSVHVPNAGTYDLTLRMAAATADAKKVRLLVDSSPTAVATFTLSGGSGWQSWKDVQVTGVSLPAGTHVLKLVADSSLFNLNYLDVKASSGCAGAATAPGWKLVLDEEFNGLDTTRWTPEDRYHMNGHLEAAMAANDTVENGVLRVQAKVENATATDGTQVHYTAGSVWTKGKWTMPNYFRLESRVKTPWQQGFHPGVIWARPNDQSDGELDFFENIGREISPDRQSGIIHQTIHSGGYGATHVQDSSGVSIGSPEGWHTVTFEKTRDLMVWKIDGVETKRVTSASKAWKDEAFEDPSKTWFIWINLQLGQSWAGDPDATTDWSPDKSAVFVDYVCVSVPS